MQPLNNIKKEAIREFHKKLKPDFAKKCISNLINDLENDLEKWQKLKQSYYLPSEIQPFISENSNLIQTYINFYKSLKEEFI